MKIRFKKLRLWLAYPFFIAFPFFARPTDLSFYAGAGMMIIGLIVRFWASGHISKSRQLATSGPYAYTRNPLYLGNFIVGLGISMVSNNAWLVLYYILIFTFLYIGTIREEQSHLSQKFGEAYRFYLASVPMFFPSLKAYSKAEQKRFDIHQSFKNGEFIRIFGFLLLIVFFYLLRAFVFNKERLAGANLAAVFVFVVFLILLWFNIYLRRKSEVKV